MQVDYREPMAAVGRMPGGRSKLEGSPNEREHETALLIEQSIAPLFAPGFSDNIQVSLTQEAPSQEPSNTLHCFVLYAMAV